MMSRTMLGSEFEFDELRLLFVVKTKVEGVFSATQNELYMAECLSFYAVVLFFE